MSVIQRFPPVAPSRAHILHGGDYNPEQWLESPEIIEQDMHLMKRAGVNVVSVGIFSWSMLEPREGQFDFKWMDALLDRLARNNIAAVLATPSGAKPHWMAAKYPEICRVDAKGNREPQGWRHNHCYSSPVYREKCTIINTMLAERYARHPALAMWHVSNEYGGECRCELCKAAFRKWLQARYETLDALNHAYWSRFWSHTYHDWSEIDFIDESVHGLTIDWKRFVTDQTVDFFKHESAPLRRLTPGVPITVNMMGMYEPLNYWKFVPHLDVISWDSYPGWHQKDDVIYDAIWTGLVHDINRSLKQKPFMLIESCPSSVNWQKISPLKRPGLHRVSSLQAIAHGSDSVMYFQWRKSRGSFEKFHGAVVDHVGHENTRVFGEVKALGEELAKLPQVVGTMPKAAAAIVFDWENRWAINCIAGARNVDKNHDQTAVEHYAPLWQRGIACDAIDMDQPFNSYRLLIAPMLYMIRPGVAERIAEFVRNGGTLVTTYLSGIVKESHLCFLGGAPGGADSPLRKVLGVWAEEIDALPDQRTQNVTAVDGNDAGLCGTYVARHFCDLIHAETAIPLAHYTTDFYAGRPAVTVNRYGQGSAYYVAARMDSRFNDDLIGRLSKDLPRALNTTLPAGVSATMRTDGASEWLFLMNFNAAPAKVGLGSQYERVTDGKPITAVELEGYDAVVLKRAV
ncbi:MAG TPA: beta-galactosidase [Tepidisphaeraceae bacterium]|nr:beta-galactosidase [Tepidisphaeraceae bacterium]